MCAPEASLDVKRGDGNAGCGVIGVQMVDQLLANIFPSPVEIRNGGVDLINQSGQSVSCDLRKIEQTRRSHELKLREEPSADSCVLVDFVKHRMRFQHNFSQLHFSRCLIGWKREQLQKFNLQERRHRQHWCKLIETTSHNFPCSTTDIIKS